MQQKLINKNGKVIGVMTETKGIYDKNGMPIGNVPINTNIVVNQFGGKIGTIDNEGFYKDNNGKVIGKFEY